MQTIYQVDITLLIKGKDYTKAVERLTKILHREYIQIVKIKEKETKLPDNNLTSAD